MSNETLRDLIVAFNRQPFPSFAAFRKLTDTVTLGKIWLKTPRLGTDLAYTIYFVLSGSECIGAVLEMDIDDLHWYVLEEHRKHGHLHRALHECILPHIFRDGRDSQLVTVESAENAAYVIRQGFIPKGAGAFVMHKDQVDVSIAPDGHNASLSRDEKDALKARLWEAKALVTSVHEALCCRYGHDALCLDDLACTVGRSSFDLHDLNEDGYLPL